MVELRKVLDQLSKVGYKARLWQRAEVKELCNVLHENETIFQATNGYYEGGFGLLVATDQRLLLVDRKPMFLTLDSIAYHMIQEISYNYRLFNSTLHIYTSNKCLDFSSWTHSQMRGILNQAQSQMRAGSRQLGDASSQPATQDLNEQARYMQYEPLTVAEPDISDIPFMPTPFQQASYNDNIHSAYSTTSTLNNLPVEPTSLSTDTPLVSYRPTTLNVRNYARRFY